MALSQNPPKVLIGNRMGQILAGVCKGQARVRRAQQGAQMGLWREPFCPAVPPWTAQVFASEGV